MKLSKDVTLIISSLTPTQGQADVVFVGRQFQKNPGTVWAFADELGVTLTVAHQIEWGFMGRGKVGRKAKF